MPTCFSIVCTSCFLPLQAVYKLKQMGFEESDVLDALRVCNNNESAAVSKENFHISISVHKKHSQILSRCIEVKF